MSRLNSRAAVGNVARHIDQPRKSLLFRSLGVKLALKICIKQVQAIIYRNFTIRKGTFLFIESFQAYFNPCHVQTLVPTRGIPHGATSRFWT